MFSYYSFECRLAVVPQCSVLISSMFIHGADSTHLHEWLHASAHVWTHVYVQADDTLYDEPDGFTMVHSNAAPDWCVRVYTTCLGTYAATRSEHPCKTMCMNVCTVLCTDMHVWVCALGVHCTCPYASMHTTNTVNSHVVEQKNGASRAAFGERHRPFNSGVV